MSDYPMLISNKLHSFRNFRVQIYAFSDKLQIIRLFFCYIIIELLYGSLSCPSPCYFKFLV